MILYYTPSCKTLAEQISLPKGSCSIEQFDDHEWHVTVHDNVHNKKVWVMAQTGAPADNLVQLLLLCDALHRSGARLNLLITYFGYARQDKAKEGEALASEIMCRLLNICSPERIEVMHLHNPDICNYGTTQEEKKEFKQQALLTNHYPYPFFYDCVSDADIIVAPDKGARKFATHIAYHTKKELLVFEKHRPEPEKVIMHFEGEVQGKRVLIVDDMITTGSTIIQAAQLLHDHGAQSIRVAATHGVFAHGALSSLERSIIEKVSITNTLAQTQTSPKVSVVNIAPFIQKILER